MVKHNIFENKSLSLWLLFMLASVPIMVLLGMAKPVEAG